MCRYCKIQSRLFLWIIRQQAGEKRDKIIQSNPVNRGMGSQNCKFDRVSFIDDFQPIDETLGPKLDLQVFHTLLRSLVVKIILLKQF